MRLAGAVGLGPSAGAADHHQLPVRVIRDDLEICLAACQLGRVDRHSGGLAVLLGWIAAGGGAVVVTVTVCTE